MMTMECEASVSCSSSGNCYEVDNDGVELSETACSVEFNKDQSTSPIHDLSSSCSTSSPASSSVEQFSIHRRTIVYDDGGRPRPTYTSPKRLKPTSQAR